MKRFYLPVFLLCAFLTAAQDSVNPFVKMAKEPYVPSPDKAGLLSCNVFSKTVSITNRVGKIISC
jgi:hypothetical protein